MALTKKSAKEYEDISIDDLLEQLTEEDIEKLNQELFDPDVSVLKNYGDRLQIMIIYY